MTVRELFTQDKEFYVHPFFEDAYIEIYDNTYEVCYGELTRPYEWADSIDEQFADVLDYECWVDGETAVIMIDPNYDCNAEDADEYVFSEESVHREERLYDFIRAIGLSW